MERGRETSSLRTIRQFRLRYFHSSSVEPLYAFVSELARVSTGEKIRDAIDTIGKKGVLLLGRFTGGRIAILERLRDELRKRDFLPLIFNFDKPETKDFTETVRLLDAMSRFVIVDITNPDLLRSNYRRPCLNT